MKVIKVSCPGCGAPLQNRDNELNEICEYCGISVHYEGKEIKSILPNPSITVTSVWPKDYAYWIVVDQPITTWSTTTNDTTVLYSDCENISSNYQYVAI